MPKQRVVKQVVKAPPGAEELKRLMLEAAKEHQGPAMEVVTREYLEDDEDDETTSKGGEPAAAAAAAAAAPAPKPQPRPVITLESIKRWKVLYPAYFNKNYTCAQGRRVPKDIAFENPTVLHIARACGKLGYQSIVIQQYKRYPREFGVFGRVRLLYRDENHEPLVPGINNSHQLLVAIAKMIPLAQPPKRELTAKEQKKAAKKASKKRR